MTPVSHASLVQVCCPESPASQGSNELNPLLKGPYTRSRLWPTWPWAAGTYQRPRGRLCRICEYVFALGGFAEAYFNIDNIVARLTNADDASTVADEISETQAVLIKKVNSGEITMRLRGKKRKHHGRASAGTREGCRNQK